VVACFIIKSSYLSIIQYFLLISRAFHSFSGASHPPCATDSKQALFSQHPGTAERRKKLDAPEFERRGFRDKRNKARLYLQHWLTFGLFQFD
jgi:hypothetical protein